MPYRLATAQYGTLACRKCTNMHIVQLRANGGIQTRDLLITNQLLYQLSYISDEEKFITNLE